MSLSINIKLTLLLIFGQFATQMDTLFAAMHAQNYPLTCLLELSYFARRFLSKSIANFSH